MPYQEMPPPLAYYHSSRQEKHAEEFIRLATEFVRALERESGRVELRMRVAPFAGRIESGSRYQDLRDKAYQRLSAAFQQAATDGMAERLSVAHLRGDPTSSRFADVVWADVDKYLGDADSVLRFPSETFRYCAWLTESLCYPFLELIPFGYELRGIRELVEGTHLRGSFLLVAAHDIVSSIPQDEGRYWNLVTTIVMSPETMVAAKAAAEDLVTTLPVDDGQAVAENSDAAPALPPVAPIQSAPSGQPHAQQAATTAPVVGSEVNGGSLSADEAARITGRDKTLSPKRYLTSWWQILHALQKGGYNVQRITVKRLNKTYAGPIAIGTQGAQPNVDEITLLEWWNGLEQQFHDSKQQVRDLEQRQADAKATTATQYPSGRDGIVVPDIGGRVKRRRNSPK